MKLILASHNPQKIAELRSLLAECLPEAEVLPPDAVGLTGEVEETGATFEENALLKARAVSQGRYIGVGDDSGLTVDALNGEPGVWSARFAARSGLAGEHDDAANNRLLLERLREVPDGARGAAFVCCIACVLPDGRSFTVRGEVRGSILRAYRGAGGFGYDPLFLYAPLGRSFAELTPAEKNAVSHRGVALRGFAARLARELAGGAPGD